MNKEEPYRDQAERLKQRIQKINEKVEYGDELPPREQIHRQKKKKTKWKLRFPVIRLLVVCFILLPIIIFSVISYRDNGKKILGTEKTSSDSIGYETINLDNNEDESKADSVKTEDHIQNDSNVSSPKEQSEVPLVEEKSTDDSSQQPTQSVPASSNKAPGDQQQTDKNSSTQTVTKKTEPTVRVKYHKVQPGEGLFRIAMDYYQSQKGIDIIKKANNLTSENIYAGQVLKIPLNN
ncbi:LysM peptidoglycan-binding domain-containing protein [Neobacillus sp. PS2-9]|uniref:LysM peptidoglycan-binding domain-containing protein n=1 Tax=Neobacillus sp. PS2-9 TaxID=3070676 RepID=UPI0027E1E3D5|nr:LysM peptidoglycan-binding domain-containing protein [Neobacillus sp. PS2-9]WML59900.1 LysM peptidoglycan-binding domain-containing protein [Neobacillus sp. PS2-9]